MTANNRMLLLSAGLQERVEELKQVMQEDKSTKEMLKVRRLSAAVCATSSHGCLVRPSALRKLQN